MKLSPAKTTTLIIAALFAAALCLLFAGCDSEKWHVFGSNRPSPTPAFTPDPLTQKVIEAGNPFAMSAQAPQPWLFIDSTDPSIKPGAVPEKTLFRSRCEPIIKRTADAWEITFKPL